MKFRVLVHLFEASCSGEKFVSQACPEVEVDEWDNLIKKVEDVDFLMETFPLMDHFGFRGRIKQIIPVYHLEKK